LTLHSMSGFCLSCLSALHNSQRDLASGLQASVVVPFFDLPIPMSDRPILTKEERRLKREEKRAKQRDANIGRAIKFHEARIAWEKEHAEPSSSHSPQRLPRELVGCSGWFYWHWRESFYPSNLPTSAWFSHYASRYGTVELNAPFYAWPTIKTVESWVRQTAGRQFVYTVKVCELITHLKRFQGTKTLIKDFCHIADILGQRMGCFLFQLPPSFTYSPGRLRNIVSQLDSSRRNVVEFRHRSWWNKKVFSAFRDHGIIFCSCSGPRLPEELIKTAEDVYIRFHGVRQWYRHDYTSAELTAWATKIKESGARNVFAYFNNDRDGFALSNARSLLRLLKR
jgi:uncharacterized protein YecE (DUF72 family)